MTGVTLLVAIALRTEPGRAQGPGWISPGDAVTLPESMSFANERGRLGLLLDGGPASTADHPFFMPVGENRRACVTCHQPMNAMSVSVASIRDRWRLTGGRDPLFEAVDGSNNPALLQQLESTHSLLLTRGLFRVSLPWPPASGRTPEFTIEVVSDPTGVNRDPRFGLASARPMVSVFRRPRPAANLKYVLSPDGTFNIKTGELMALDPDTGRPASMNMMADARHLTLKQQASGAYADHLEGIRGLSAAELAAIEGFESRIYMAQVEDRHGRLKTDGGPEGLGPGAMRDGLIHVLGNNNRDPVFRHFTSWLTADGPALAALPSPAREFRASVARGNDIFMFRQFWLRDVAHINSVGLGNPIKRTCSTCHNAQMSGMDLAPGWVDVGTNNFPTWTAPPVFSANADLPVFKVTCRSDAPPHPYLGREIYTTDPGRALITGRCNDVGSIVMQQLRGLSSRAPYFANGSAATLGEVVDFYDRRFDMKLTEREKQDLVNFLGVL